MDVAVSNVKRRIKEVVADLQDFYVLSSHGLVGFGRKPFYGRDAIEQMEYAGAGSLVIVFIVDLFVGMALSLQLSAELSSLGMKMYIGMIVGISVVRELGPVVTALVFTGRVGAGMASELGSMVLGHQVDTIRVFGFDPIKKLVTPRIVSALIMLPALTIIGVAVSLLGGYYIAVYVSNQSGTFYWTSIRNILTPENVLAGAIKPFIFGYLISSICCYMGLSTRGGSVGLRQATTRAVVLSIVFIIISDFLLTRVLLYVLGFSV